MKANDFGIDVRSGQHTLNPLAGEESRFLGLLWVDHEGETEKISATELATRWNPPAENFEQQKRCVRLMQNHLLIDHNIPVLSKAGAGGGYWIAATEEEAEAFYATFRQRGLTGLVKASRGKQSAMVDMVTQLSFEFEDLVDKTTEFIPSRIRPRGPMPAPVEVVDRFLSRMAKDPELYADGFRKIGEKYGADLMPEPIEVVDRFLAKMTEDPQQFADGLRKIGEKYGSVLLPRDRVIDMQRRVAELSSMVESMVN